MCQMCQGRVRVWPYAWPYGGMHARVPVPSISVRLRHSHAYAQQCKKMVVAERTIA
jgi:hypothetical protein